MATLASPSSGQLKSNYVPDEAERSIIAKSIGGPERKVNRLQQDISSLRRALAKATEQKAQLQSSIKQHHVLLSPFRRLSNEILLTIFMFCLPGNHNATMDPKEPPLLLGRVCRRWRFVAHSSPRLWTSLHISFPTAPSASDGPSPPDLERFNLRMLFHQASMNEWLLHSGSLPISLSLHICHSGTFNTLRADDYRGYLVLLISVLHRVRILEAAIPFGDFSVFFASLMPEETPMLERLQLTFAKDGHGWATDNAHDDRWKYAGLLRSRSLREIRLIGFPFSSSLAYTDVQWYFLTHLDIIRPQSHWMPLGMTLNDAHCLLLQCYNLLHLGIDIVDALQTTCPAGWVKLPFLQSITLFDAAYHLATLIDRMEVPNLQIVHYRTKFPPMESRRSPLIALLSINQRRTKSLTANIGFLSLNELLWLFFYTPNLTWFHHEFQYFLMPYEQSEHRRMCLTLPFDILKAFIEFLIPDEQGRCSFPNLEHLHIAEARFDVIDVHLIRRLVKGRARRQPGTQSLKQVRIDEVGYTPAHDSSSHFNTRLTTEEDGMEGVTVEFRPASPPHIMTPLPTGHFDRGRKGEASRRGPPWQLHPYPIPRK